MLVGFCATVKICKFSHPHQTFGFPPPPNLFLERHNLSCLTVTNKILLDIVVHVTIMFWICLGFPCYISNVNILLYLFKILIKR